jgi:hypothetical protein
MDNHTIVAQLLVKEANEYGNPEYIVQALQLINQFLQVGYDEKENSKQTDDSEQTKDMLQFKTDNE